MKSTSKLWAACGLAVFFSAGAEVEAANCALRSPDRQIYEMFPAATRYRTVEANVEAARERGWQAEVIDHFQISGVPGRNEPDAQQEINYPYLLDLIDELPFEGWVGCEYRPRAGTEEGLGWARPYGIEVGNGSG